MAPLMCTILATTVNHTDAAGVFSLTLLPSPIWSPKTRAFNSATVSASLNWCGFSEAWKARFATVSVLVIHAHYGSWPIMPRLPYFPRPQRKIYD